MGRDKLPLAPSNPDPSKERASTFVKFQRWMKCRARSRAERPCTATPMSRHGIRGMVSLSIKSGGAGRIMRGVRETRWELPDPWHP